MGEEERIKPIVRLIRAIADIRAGTIVLCPLCVRKRIWEVLAGI